MATIKLREKQLTDGRLSLYLDIYENSIRRYEFLKLYIYPETNDTIRAKNRDTRKFAEVVRSKRLVEAQNAVFGFATRHDKALLLPTYEKFTKGRNSSLYSALGAHLRQRCPDTMKVAQINERWLTDFVRYLRGLKVIEKKEQTTKRKVTDNSIGEYIGSLRVFWRWCVKRNIVQGNPFEIIELERKKAEREYLTIEELQTLIDTPTKYRVREPFLFSCFTGLRWSDVVALRWGDVEEFAGRTRLRFTQQKTQAHEYMDLNAQAVVLMGERGENEANIFTMVAPGNANSQLCKWVRSAGIKKRITFHCARHTFATMLLTLDTDIYTVSKLLGHSSVATTQIYAKIVDKKKQEAVDKIPQML